MLKPADDEIKSALEEIELMRERGTDPHHIVKTLQYLEHRVRCLETVYEAASNYLHSGLGEREHALLENALEMARQGELRDREQEDEKLGL